MHNIRQSCQSYRRKEEEEEMEERGGVGVEGLMHGLRKLLYV